MPQETYKMSHKFVKFLRHSSLSYTASWFGSDINSQLHLHPEMSKLAAEVNPSAFQGVHRQAEELIKSD